MIVCKKGGNMINKAVVLLYLLNFKLGDRLPRCTEQLYEEAERWYKEQE